MNYANIKKTDIANGEGVRVSLFVSGCRHHCKNCFNPETWSFDYGNLFDENVEKEIIEALDKSYINGLSILGGEPFEPENQHALADFTEKVKDVFPEKSIWCYTGCVIEDLKDPKSTYFTPYTAKLLSNIDILVDGPFVEALKDISLKFRGSSNQRVIDMNKSAHYGKIILWCK